MLDGPEHTLLRPHWARAPLSGPTRSATTRKKRDSSEREGNHGKRRRRRTEDPRNARDHFKGNRRSSNAVEDALHPGTGLITQTESFGGQWRRKLHKSHIEPAHLSAAVNDLRSSFWNSSSTPNLPHPAVSSPDVFFNGPLLPRGPCPEDPCLPLSVLFQEALSFKTPASEAATYLEAVDLISLASGPPFAFGSAEEDGSHRDLRTLHRPNSPSVPDPRTGLNNADISGHQSQYFKIFLPNTSRESVLPNDQVFVECPTSPKSDQPGNNLAWQNPGPIEVARLHEHYPNNLTAVATNKVWTADSCALGCNNPSMARDIEASLLPHAIQQDIWGGDCVQASVDNATQRKDNDENDAAASTSIVRDRWRGEPIGPGIGNRSSYGSVNIPLPSIGER